MDASNKQLKTIDEYISMFPDDVQKIQMVFIANCRDETTTHRGVQDFLNWLEDHGEQRYLVQRARSRREISDFIRSRSQRNAGGGVPADTRRRLSKA